MHIAKYITYFLLGVVLSTGFIHAPVLLAADGGGTTKAEPAPAQSGTMYLPSDDPMAELAAKLNTAKENNKRLLVVMGGNWCHDSRALASRLYEEPLGTTIEAHYETLFVDVGYLQKGKEVITSLGIPVYYATPTVLIVNPDTGRVINAHNRHQWGDAATISMADSLEYFRQFADIELSTSQNETVVDAQLQELLTEIGVFEQEQADRLYGAYAVLAPMLRAYKEGDRGAFSDELWNEVRDFRYKVPVDLDALRAQARAGVAAGETDVKLNYPVYPAFSWDPS